VQIVSIDEKMRIAWEISDGTRFLHTSYVFHRDLKSLNILLDENNHVRITDFGSSKQVEETMTHASNMSGTPLWTAPEILEGSPFRKPADIYSFGVILWELITNQIPWEGLTGDIKQLQECLSYCPEVRLSFGDIDQRLKDYLDIR
jgi:serine/threonine protein kinase